MEDDGQRADIRTWGLRLTVAFILLFLMGPVLIIVGVSFNGSALLSFPPQNWDVRWYTKLLGDASWQRSMWSSVQVALLTTVIAGSLGFCASLALLRGNLKAKTAVYGFLLTPMIVPGVISAVAYYLAFSKMGAAGSVLAIALGHAALALPLVIIVLSSGLQGLDERYERAALSLGAGHFYTLRRITVPLAVPALISAALFAFLSSFDELLISLFLAGAQTQTITVRIWNSLQMDVDPSIAAVSSVLIAVTVVVLAANAFLQKSAKV